MKVTVSQKSEVIKQGQEIRYQVFTVEQSIPTELDLDGLDNQSFHALVTDHDSPIATARLTVHEDCSATMARVAVDKAYRGKGIASKVVSALQQHAKSIGVSSIEIHAHEYLRAYYEKLGFEFIEEVEIVGEHQLIAMEQKLLVTE